MLYQVDNPADKAMGGLGQAAQTFSKMDKDNSVDAPGKTIGGGIMSGLGGAGAGAGIGMAMATGPVGWGAVSAGAALGVASYLFS